MTFHELNSADRIQLLERICKGVAIACRMGGIEEPRIVISLLDEKAVTTSVNFDTANLIGLLEHITEANRRKLECNGR